MLTELASADALPDSIADESELDALLTRPSERLIAQIRTISSPLVVLGAGGKMGPTLAVLAKRAAMAARRNLDVVAVSRFTDHAARRWLEARDVRTIGCDLLDRNATSHLPDSEDVIYLVGLKFGTHDDPATTWAMNVLAPARVAERYGQARIVALSTGNVYPPSPASRGGAVESDPLTPVGEYANSVVGRERIFDFYARRAGLRVALLRLFYAVELRYGALVDIGRRVYCGEAIDVANAHFNCIWQGDANEMILRSLDLASAPSSAWNLCRPDIYSVRATAMAFGKLFGRDPKLIGREQPEVLLGNATRICDALGAPRVDADRMMAWIAHWIAQGGRDLGKPTHFETRDGKY